ncbi:MAG TPA: CBS domain-containing protein [Chloroflexota bacterium]|nr:CBS domain-containing protein [Chloroflexota bacterium]
MIVRDWMQSDAPTASPDTPVTDLARIMTMKKIAHVTVVASDGGVAGVVTAADMIARHARLHLPTYFSLLGFSIPIESERDDREIEKALSTRAADLMSKRVITVEPDADIDSAATLMIDHGVSFLPVVENGRLLGTIDENDIVRLLVVEETGDATS